LFAPPPGTSVFDRATTTPRHTSWEEFVANKAEFVDMLAQRLDGDRKRAAAALDAVIDTVYLVIARGEKVAITGFGVFERRDRAARTARNPATGAPVSVAASRVPAFRPGTEFKAIASGAKDFAETRAARAQGAGDAARDAPGKATAAVRKKTGRESTAESKSTTKKSSSTAKQGPGKSAAKKSTAGKSTANKSASTAKKAAAKKTASKSAAKKSTAKKSTAKKVAAKKKK